MDGPNNGIVLYHYSFSPYARRVIWYLALRGIDYAQVVQPPVMPRPDLEAIGVKYRRIPLMAVGKDVYCDTRLMLSKLNELFPGSALEAATPEQKAIQQLLSSWTIDGGIFMRASQLIPSNMPLLNDPKFTKDREQLSGRKWDKKSIDANRPEAVAVIRNGFEFLESGLLADGREWILKTDKPTMADIEAIWPFDWLNGLKGGLPKDLISERQFPKTFAWIARFNKAIKAANETAPKPVKLKGKDAAQRIFESSFAEQDGEVDPMDPTAFKKGTKVDVWPIDSGFTHKDRGTLLTLNGEEIVIGLDNGLRLHVPRHGFRIKLAGHQKKSKL